MPNACGCSGLPLTLDSQIQSPASRPQCSHRWNIWYFMMINFCSSSYKTGLFCFLCNLCVWCCTIFVQFLFWHKKVRQRDSILFQGKQNEHNSIPEPEKWAQFNSRAVKMDTTQFLGWCLITNNLTNFCLWQPREHNNILMAVFFLELLILCADMFSTGTIFATCFQRWSNGLKSSLCLCVHPWIFLVNNSLWLQKY